MNQSKCALGFKNYKVLIISILPKTPFNLVPHLTKFNSAVFHQVHVYMYVHHKL